MTRMGADTVSGVIGTILAGSISPFIGGIQAVRTATSLIQDMSSMIADGIDASKKPTPIYNVPNSSSLALAQGFLGWIFQRETLSKAEAEQLDDYFTMFGYAQNKIKNIATELATVLTARPKFTYLKTKGFSVKGHFPSEYKNEFNEVFNNGITFWKTSATVGDYSGNTV